MTWPISCTRISSTKPTAYFQPQIEAYATTDTAIDPTTVNALSLSSTAPNFAKNAPTAMSGANSRRSDSRQVGTGGAGGPASSGGISGGWGTTPASSLITHHDSPGAAVRPARTGRMGHASRADTGLRARRRPGAGRPRRADALPHHAGLLGPLADPRHDRAAARPVLARAGALPRRRDGRVRPRRVRRRGLRLPRRRVRRGGPSRRRARHGARPRDRRGRGGGRLPLGPAHARRARALR